MEKRDPLREVGNHSDNNEIQEAEKEPAIPEVATSSEKENGVMTKNTDAEKARCGKLRLSFLKAFDPLYSESPGKSDASLQPERKRPQLIIEDSDSDRSPSPPAPFDVSDDDAAFVDATYIATSDDEIKGDPETSVPKQVLDESLLKFYTPNKFNTTLPKPTAETTSEPPNKESVLAEEPVSTSVVNQSVEEVKISDSAEEKVHSPTGDISESIEVEKGSDKCEDLAAEQAGPAPDNKEQGDKCEDLAAEQAGPAPDNKEQGDKCEDLADEQAAPAPDNKEQDNSAASEPEANAGNISDSTYSEISEIKTDSPAKSKENSENELNGSGEYSTAKSQIPNLPEHTDKLEKVTSSDDTDTSVSPLTTESSGKNQKEERKSIENLEPIEEDNAKKPEVVEDIPKSESDEEELAISTFEHLVNGIYTSESFSSAVTSRSSGVAGPAVESSGVSPKPGKSTLKEKTSEEKLNSENKEAAKEEGHKDIPQENAEESDGLDTVPLSQSDEDSFKENLEALEKEADHKSFEDQTPEGNAKEIFESYIDDSTEPLKDTTATSPQTEEQHTDSEVESQKPVEDTTPEVEEDTVETNKEEHYLGAEAEARGSIEDKKKDRKPKKEKKERNTLIENRDSFTDLDSLLDYIDPLGGLSSSTSGGSSEESSERSSQWGTEETSEESDKGPNLTAGVQTHEPIEDTKSPAEGDSAEANNKAQNLSARIETGKSIEDTKSPTGEGSSEAKNEKQDLKTNVETGESIEDTEFPTGEDTDEAGRDRNLSSAGETRRSIDRREDGAIIAAHQDEEQHLDSGVDSIEESYTKSPKSSAGNVSENKEDGNLADDEAIEECRVESDTHLTSDDDSKTLSVGSEQTLTETNTSDRPDSSESEELTVKAEDKPEDTAKPVADNTAFDAGFYKAKMADLSERLSEQQQENSDLKLQLNASQQAKASLELEIRQKEEIIIKTQAEALKNEQVYKQEIKQLREKLKENSKLIEKDGSKELEEQLKEAKAREAKAIAELNQRNKDDLNYQKIMEEYENTIATRFADYQKLKEEHETATRHLANIELAFSDVHQKYERTKALLEGFKSNEETLSQSLQASEKTCKQHEERYESLKAHAKAQIEKSNKEILTSRDKYETDMSKLRAIVKRLEIKCSSLEVSLQQKAEECAALSALCDEVTGKKV